MRPRIRENTVHATRNTPMSCVEEYIETTTIEKRWIYHLPGKSRHFVPKALPHGRVKHIVVPRKED